MEEKDLCATCKLQLCRECAAKFAPELPKPTEAIGVVNLIITIGGLFFLGWCIVGFMRDCGMASCGRLM